MAKLLNEERFLPSRLPGLSLWLDAQATTTITATTTGITSWADRSGAGNTFNTSTFSVPGCVLWLDAADTTTYTGTTSISTVKNKGSTGGSLNASGGVVSANQYTMNGKPVFRFPAGVSLYESTTFTTIYRTVFAVTHLTTVNNPGILNNVICGSYVGIQLYGYANSILALGTCCQNGARVSFPSYPLYLSGSVIINSNALITAANTPGRIFFNGSSQVLDYSPPWFTFTPGTEIQYIGGQDTVDIAELIIFDGQLTTEQQQQVEGYLSYKWNIPLSYTITPANSVFSSCPPPVISNTLITGQPSIFFPPGAQMTSTLNSGMGSLSVPGCVLWLDAADTTTYVGPTSSLTGWKDKSGSGFVATPIDGAITTTTQNGSNVLNFGGNRMIIPNFTWNMSFTSIVVWKADNAHQMIGLCSSTAANATWYDYIFSGNWSLILLNNATSSTDPNYVQGTTDPNPGSPASIVPANQWFIFSIGYTAGTTTITNYAVNGTARTSTAVTPQSGTNTGVYFINGLANYPYASSQIAEIMHFNRSINYQERQTVEGYLATKWGLRASLPSLHPYSAVPYSGTFTLNPSNPISKSLFIAYQTPALTSTMRFATGNDVSGGAFGVSQTQYSISAPYQYAYGDTRWPTDLTIYTLPTVLSAIYDATAGIIRGDHNFNAGADVRESAMINSIVNTPYSLGASSIPSSIVLSASFHVCEIIAYNRALATTDRQMIEGYLAVKWGLTGQLPNGHPYKNFAPSGEQVVIPSTPANVMQGLVSWIDMADSASYTLSGGSTLKTLTDKADGTTTYTLSGKANNFSMSTIGSLPALVFPGNNTSVLTANTFLSRTLPIPSQGSAFIVLTPKSQFTATKLGILGWGSPGNGNAQGNPGLGYNSPSTNVQTLQSYNTSSGIFFGPSFNLSASTPTILFWAWYGGNMTYLSCNGTTLLSGPRGTTANYNPASADTQFYVGNDGGFGAQFTLGEMCVYNQYAETPFRNLMEGHLAWKWGLQTNLPAGHPYVYSAPGLQSLTEVNALSEPSDITGLTMWLDAADTTTINVTGTTSFTWTDKSPVLNHLVSSTTTLKALPLPSNFGLPVRPSIYFGPGASATSTYTSGASTGQFSAFMVASVPTLSYLLISTGQFTTATSAAGANGQTFAFYASNGSTFGVCSPFVSPGGANVGSYSTVCGATVELFASVSGSTTLGNLNYGATVSGTCTTIPATQWVFGDCSGDPSPKSFHVHEFITYSRQLATNERWIVEGYLYWKWMHLI